MSGMKSVPLKEVLELLDGLPVKWACLAAIGVSTGCRISELLLLQRHDLLTPCGKLKEEIAFVKLKSKETNVNGEKKVVHRKISIPSDFHCYVISHLQAEEQRGYDMPSDYVFRGKHGKSLSRHTCYNKFRELLGSGHGTHWMRKTYAQELFRYLLKENPADPMRALELTRRALSHSRIDTTIRYLGFNEESLNKAQNEIFNIRRIRNG